MAAFHTQVKDDPTAVALCSCGVAGEVRALSDVDPWFARHLAAVRSERRFSPVDGAPIPTDTPDPVRTAARRLLAALTDKPSTDGMTELAAAITTLRAALGEDAT